MPLNRTPNLALDQNGNILWRSCPVNTNSVLTSGGVYESKSFETMGYTKLTVSVFSDADSDTDGLVVLQSVDEGENYDFSSPFVVSKDNPSTFTVDLIGSNAKIRYINSNTAQTKFRLMVSLSFGV